MQRLKKVLHPYSWFSQDVLFPFVVSRVLLLVVGWFSQYFVANPNYPAPQAIERGWLATPVRLLDIWGRWDSGWYYSIIQFGYAVPDPTYQTQSNIAFFPLYPYLVKFFNLLLPSSIAESRLLLIGVLISNVALLIGLTFLYKLVEWMYRNKQIAQNTIWYVLLFPAGFFLSSFYTEGLFFCLSVVSLYLAFQKKWGWACAVGFLLAFTRPTGILIGAPIAWQYFRSRDWDVRKLNGSLFWLALIPLGLLSFFNIAYNITGDYLAPMHALQAWGRTSALPWQTFFADTNVIPFVTPLESMLALFCLVIGILGFKYLHDASLAIYASLLLVFPLFSGTLNSISRYYAIIFPLFITLGALATKKPLLAKSLPYIFLGLQVLYFVAWSQFYWIA